eukprot:CAMPEP_0183737230 /NCGR_PEP_ID=MMETSP0737-20130205/51385_1 /TAXON_ID=385413 /ORGANISM="Thalassiosira miniscula, Strain CCMP1093" /LENGTH=51 /DNA_ID=CAMNT_0025971463 /DNA_START=268 /DNA_END=420 /DNA_ORIENTATION=+
MTKQEEAIRKSNTYQGPKIRVREEEDAAMWIEETNKNDANGTTGKKTKLGW